MTPFNNAGNNKCEVGHCIDGVVPTINPSIMEQQNKSFIGKACDCNRLIYNEGQCFCPSNFHWEIHWMPNPNY
jgi:hypothetical protein